MNILEKFFTLTQPRQKIPRSPEVFKTSPFDMPIGDHFRDADVKPRVAIGIQKPGYKLPTQNDYVGWCNEQIERNKLNFYKNLPHETTSNHNGAHVVAFHRSSGIRNYFNDATLDFPEARTGAK